MLEVFDMQGTRNQVSAYPTIFYKKQEVFFNEQNKVQICKCLKTLNNSISFVTTLTCAI